MERHATLVHNPTTWAVQQPRRIIADAGIVRPHDMGLFMNVPEAKTVSDGRPERDPQGKT
jgi:hypothetical protein